MRKALLVIAAVAICAPAMAGNLDPAAAIPWQAPWGNPATVTDLGGGVVKLDMAPTGSAGIFWRLPAWESEIITLEGIWQGNVDGAGWAEVMMFTSTEGLSDADIANRIDVGAAADIVAKHDSWDLGPTAFGPEDIWAAPVPPGGSDPELHATCNEVIVALKVGDGGGSGTTAIYDLTYIPEPASALLLLGGLPLLLRRRR